MPQLSDFIPFYPKKRGKNEPPPPKFDVDRALDVEVHPHPSLQRQIAENGELILRVKRNLHPAETFLSKFFKIDSHRRIVLDEYGTFMLEEAFQPDTTLADVAVKLADKFDLDLEKAKLGVVHLVKDLMLRDYVFLVQRKTTVEDQPQ